MKNVTFNFYSVLKNEDALPFVGKGLLAVADGLGGSGSQVHRIDRKKHPDLVHDIYSVAFGDMGEECSPELTAYIEGLLEPMSDETDDTSALWASRIVIARCVYALVEGAFKDADLGDPSLREKLAAFIGEGLRDTAEYFGFEAGKYDGQLLLPTTLAVIRYREREDSVIAEAVWAGDSRCYALTADGLRALSADDEDASGAITNLFYAGNQEVRLNYLRHEITKPCALFTVSDGTFDPFDPHDHMGLEWSVLSAIKESASVEALPTLLKEHYDRLHGDDATMAFEAFGFEDLEGMKATFAPRTERIEEICRLQAEMRAALEVSGMNEEEATHYVRSRTSDRYEQIVKALLAAQAEGVDDIALTADFREGSARAREANDAAKRKASLIRRRQAFDALDREVREHRDRVREMLSEDFVVPKDYALAALVTRFRKCALDLSLHYERGTRLKERLSPFEQRKEELHLLVLERIEYYQRLFCDLYSAKGGDVEKHRNRISEILWIWIRIDNSVAFCRGLQDVGKLPQTDRALSNEVAAYVTSRREHYKDMIAWTNAERRLLDEYTAAWKGLFEALKREETAVADLLTPEAYVALGFGEADVPIGEVQPVLPDKEKVIDGIVAALAAGWDKTSLIDNQYNATKLHLFRTYFYLKENPDDKIKAFEEAVAALDEGYEALVREGNEH